MGVSIEGAIERSIYVNCPLPLLDAVLAAAQMELGNTEDALIFSDIREILEENWTKIRIEPKQPTYKNKYYFVFNLYGKEPLDAFSIQIPDIMAVPKVKDYFMDNEEIFSKIARSHPVFTAMIGIKPSSKEVVDILKMLIEEFPIIICRLSSFTFTEYQESASEFPMSINEVVFKTLLLCIDHLPIRAFKFGLPGSYEFIQRLANDDIPDDELPKSYNYKNRYVFINSNGTLIPKCITEKDTVQNG